MGWTEHIRETEKPKVSGCSANNLFRMVDLPEPDGPDMTIGRFERLAGCGCCQLGVRRWGVGRVGSGATCGSHCEGLEGNWVLGMGFWNEESDEDGSAQEHAVVVGGCCCAGVWVD